MEEADERPGCAYDSDPVDRGGFKNSTSPSHGMKKVALADTRRMPMEDGCCDGL